MPATNNPRVLVIEDNNALRVVLFTILRHQPLGVDTATTCDEAMEKVRKCDYALILIDLDLPDEEATEFLTRFREFRPEATSFVLAVRDPREDLLVDPALVNAVVSKPVEIDTLAEAVRECALAVPEPDDPLPCPPSESDLRLHLERGETTLPN